MLASMPELAGTGLTVVDIAAGYANDDALIAQYGERIPVLAVAGLELDWPFNAADVQQLLPNVHG